LKGGGYFGENRKVEKSKNSDSAIGGVIKTLVILISIISPVLALSWAHFRGKEELYNEIERLRAANQQTDGRIREEIGRIRAKNNLSDTNSAHQRDLLKNDLRHFTAELDRTHKNLNSHLELGVDGLLHPAGVIVRLSQLERDVGKLEVKTTDWNRWHKRDMEGWIKLLAAENKELKVPDIND
jgi:hypothetical protein